MEQAAATLSSEGARGQPGEQDVTGGAGPCSWARRSSVRSVAALGLAVLYAACFSAIKAGLPFAPPLRFAGLRALIAGLVLLALLPALGRRLVPARQSWGWVLALAVSTTTVAFAAMFLSPGQAGAGIASVLGNMQPVVVIALAAPFLGERLTRGKLAALGLGLLGVALIGSSALAASDAYGVTGPAFALLASVAVAAGTVLAKRMGAQPNLVAIAAWQLILGSLPLLAGSALLERGSGVVWNAELVALLLFLALAGTALPTPVWYGLVRQDDVGRLTLFFFFAPVIGLGLAAAIFGERVTLPEGLGVLLALAGIALAARESHHGAATVVSTAPRPERRLEAGASGAHRRAAP